MKKETSMLIERISNSLKPGSHPGLSRVRKFCAMCGHPEQKLKTIHVAGTNGKGSVSNMTALILTEAGYKTGVFNSPFLSSPLEYFRIDGIQIDETRFVQLTESLLELALQMQEPPTEFEFFTVAVLKYFAEEHCDFSVIEAGMGGSLDATNIIQHPVLCMITNIGIDHKEYLGDTLEQIASEKAGILKPEVPAAIYPSEGTAVKVIRNRADELRIPVVAASEDRIKNFDISKQESVIDISGAGMQYTTENGQMYRVVLPTDVKFQQRNCALVLEAVEVLKKQGICITESIVCEALQKFKLPARFEIISKKPWIIADGGHNPQCIDAVIESLLPIADKVKACDGRVIVLSGIMRDKDYAYVYKKLAEIADEFILVAADVSRALTTVELESELLQYSKIIQKAATPSEGSKLALHGLKETDCLLISGSFYIMSDILAVLRSE